jgi:hypothetical protein
MLPQFSSGSGSNSPGYSFARRDAVPQPLIQFFAPPSILMPRRGSNGRRGPYRSGSDGLCEKKIECARNFTAKPRRSRIQSMPRPLWEIWPRNTSASACPNPQGGSSGYNSYNSGFTTLDANRDAGFSRACVSKCMICWNFFIAAEQGAELTRKGAASVHSTKRNRRGSVSHQDARRRTSA